ncbi:serine/threonine-protein kinase rio1-like isoform X2 [Gordionus sp. m RMFG-2023]|uniref:serine/threonine-protein kinase rio1-like isoform X2 n=1 Tax=Gordionus sp. m RMFG-2023 TaxID=3053472 RepID=UPI0031FDF253
MIINKICKEEDPDWEDDNYVDFQIQNNRISYTDQKYTISHMEKLKKFSSKINVHSYTGGMGKLQNNVLNSLKEKGKKIDNQRFKVKDKRDRATIEQVMDPRTRMILFRLLNSGVILSINGCISTGKEANVYHALGPNNLQAAIKIYKTSILIFKDRDRYVTGEFRFRQGYCRHNPRKMVKTWAEKEMRNLLRIHKAGIKCPEPLLLKGHVLVMRFLGKDGWPSPLMKDISLDANLACTLYLKSVVLLWDLYRLCKLVHADLSEFNLICHDDELYVIDVSQSVEWDHPRAFDFLRKDITNITQYFHKNNVNVMTVRQLFDFITDPAINLQNRYEYLDIIDLPNHYISTQNGTSINNQIDEEVFKQAFIPRKLDEIIDHEKDFDNLTAGLTKELYYCRISGIENGDYKLYIKKDSRVPQALISLKDLSIQNDEPGFLTTDNKNQNDFDIIDVGESERNNSTYTADSDSESVTANEDSTSSHSHLTIKSDNVMMKQKYVKYQRDRDESPNSKKERKQAVKDEKREKRETKTPKYEKKKQNAKKYCRQGWKRK